MTALNTQCFQCFQCFRSEHKTEIIDDYLCYLIFIFSIIFLKEDDRNWRNWNEKNFRDRILTSNKWFGLHWDWWQYTVLLKDRTILWINISWRIEISYCCVTFIEKLWQSLKLFMSLYSILSYIALLIKLPFKNVM